MNPEATSAKQTQRKTLRSEKWPRLFIRLCFDWRADVVGRSQKNRFNSVILKTTTADTAASKCLINVVSSSLLNWSLCSEPALRSHLEIIPHTLVCLFVCDLEAGSCPLCLTPFSGLQTAITQYSCQNRSRFLLASKVNRFWPKKRAVVKKKKAVASLSSV